MTVLFTKSYGLQNQKLILAGIINKNERETFQVSPYSWREKVMSSTISRLTLIIEDKPKQNENCPFFLLLK